MFIINAVSTCFEHHYAHLHIVNTAYSNSIPQTLLSRLRHGIQQKYSLPKTPTPNPTTNPPTNKNTKWATFTYKSPQIRKITNLFKHTNIRIAYKCTNTISHLSKPTNKATLPSSPYDRSGIYKLTCNKAYVGQTSRNLKQRYKEHTRYIKNNNPQSAYALHILNNQHEYGPIEKTMTLLKPVKNISLLTPYEQFFIQAFHKYGKLISEQNPSEPNPLLQMAIIPSHPPTWSCLLNSNLHSARTLQRGASQPLPTTSSRTRYVADFTLNLHPYTNLPITGVLPLVHLITPAPHTSPIKQAQHMHQNTCSRYTRPEKHMRQIPVPTLRHTHLHTTFAYTHDVRTRFTTHYPTKNMLRLISSFPRLLQRSTPHAVTHGLCSPEDGHNDAQNMLRQCW